MQGMKVIELLEILAHDRSDPVVYFTAKTLPASNALTDPNAGTLGNGLALDVPSWANAGEGFISYTEGTPSSGSYVTMFRYASPDATSTLLPTDDGTGGGIAPLTFVAPGAAFPILVSGAARLSFAMRDSDGAVPGVVTLKIVWLRR